MDLVSGDKGGSDSSEPAQQSDNNESSEPADNEAYYSAIAAKLSEDATTIGEIVYNGNLSYSNLSESEFDGVLEMEVLKDSDWIEGDDGGMITYAEAVYNAVIVYYDSWLSGNTDEDLVGINRLELGEIRHDDNGYYALVRVTYADKDGGISEELNTCYLTVNGNSMCIERIGKEENEDE